MSTLPLIILADRAWVIQRLLLLSLWSFFYMQYDVNLKIKQAYCPPRIIEANPCVEYVQYIVLPWFEGFEVQRGEKNGGNKYV